MHEKDNDVIKQIKLGKDKPLVDIYMLYRDEFIIWSIQNNTINEEQAKDIFQDAIIDFQDNIRTGQLKEFNSSLKTYLFQIGKFKIINFLKREKRITYLPDTKFIKSETNDYVQAEENEHKLDDIAQALSKLPEDCQRLLRLYYFKEYDMSSIARELNYKNADTAKSKKSICMKKLLAELAKLSKILVL
ncbi:MAG: hypothetical protein CL855_07730 [Cryomorphaceae bacterium]|nr:hypothetical protein [Cryomorphaceae bacterium]